MSIGVRFTLGSGTGRFPFGVSSAGTSGSRIEHMTTALGAYAHTVHVAYLTRRNNGPGQFGKYVQERYSVSIVSTSPKPCAFKVCTVVWTWVVDGE